jgi:hypothetical protein
VLANVQKLRDMTLKQRRLNALREAYEESSLCNWMTRPLDLEELYRHAAELVNSPMPARLDVPDPALNIDLKSTIITGFVAQAEERMQARERALSALLPAGVALLHPFTIFRCKNCRRTEPMFASLAIRHSCFWPSVYKSVEESVRVLFDGYLGTVPWNFAGTTGTSTEAKFSHDSLECDQGAAGAANELLRISGYDTETITWKDFEDAPVRFRCQRVPCKKQSRYWMTFSYAVSISGIHLCARLTFVHRSNIISITQDTRVTSVLRRGTCSATSLLPCRSKKTLYS